ncbi:beta-hexosaminidase subunit beta-like [Brachionus plicatilis]|uniref:Beta-hexosaminidase subunit beta-like n=1 Tax=Brachionus plicatilis TaxID=10195 RepID=A0A3M7QTT3_BRAPC|nr:beta-hexosaminidase subunit beta-like [Brachionus plicatilis]
MHLINLFVLLYLAQTDCKLYPIAVRLPLNGTPPDLGGSLWPRPNFQRFGPERFFIDKNFKIELDSGLNVCEKDLLEKLWVHYQSVLYPPKLKFQAPASSDLVLKSISFKLITNSPEFILSSCAEKYYPFIQDTETESYKLNAGRIGVQVVAKSVWGLIRGLETFSQLVYTPLNTNKAQSGSLVITEQLVTYFETRNPDQKNTTKTGHIIFEVGNM